MPNNQRRSRAEPAIREKTTTREQGARKSPRGTPKRRPLGRYRYVRVRWRVLFGLIDFLGGLLFGLGHWVRGMFSGSSSKQQRADEEPNVILLVQLDHMGDAIISTAMLPLLRRRYPRASIEVLAGPWNREVFEMAEQVDRVHVSRVNRFARGGWTRFAWMLSMFWWGWRLRWREIDLAVDIRGEFPVAVMLWLSGARRRLGWGCAGGGFLMTDRAGYVPNRPEIQSRLVLLAELGIRWKRGKDVPRPRVTADVDTETMESLLRKAQSQGPTIVMHVGAGTQAKTWPVERWRELLGRVITEHGAQVVLVGGKSDRIVARRLLAGRPWPGVVDLTGKLTLAETATLMRRSDLAVGADSGPAHLATAVDTPLVVLFSGTNHPTQWRPCGQRVVVVRHEVACSPCHRERCPSSDHPCMNGLRASVVAEKIAECLRQPLADSLVVADSEVPAWEPLLSES